MKYVLIFCFLLQSTVHAASTVFIRDYRLPQTDFIAEMRMRKTGQTFHSYMLKNLEPQYLTANLKAAFITAQTDFLNSDLSQTNQSWENVVAYAYKANWSENHRNMISNAYMRLAQLSKNSNEQNGWLEQLLVFNSNFKPNIKLFPPPLVNELQRLNMLSAKAIISTQNWQDFDLIVINGVSHTINIETAIQITEGMKYITLLSSAYQPVHKVLHTDSLKNLRVTPVPLFSGNCNDLKKINLPKNFSENIETEVIAHNNCNNVTIGLLSLNNTSATRNLHTPSIENSLNTKEVAFYEKPKFWLTTALITAALIIHKNSKKDKDENPSTHKEGF